MPSFWGFTAPRGSVKHLNRQICCVFAAAWRIMSWTDSFWKSESGFCGTFEAGQKSALSAATNALSLQRKYLSDDVNRLAVMIQSYCNSAGSWSYSWESSGPSGASVLECAALLTEEPKTGRYSQQTLFWKSVISKEVKWKRQ